MLRWFEDVTTPLVGDLLLRWPLLPDLQRASEKSLRRFFHQHNGRGEKRLQERLEQIRQGVPATTDAALLRVGRLRIQQACACSPLGEPRLRSLTRRLKPPMRRIRTVSSPSRFRERAQRWNRA
jgi:hypothetical protein